MERRQFLKMIAMGAMATVGLGVQSARAVSKSTTTPAKSAGTSKQKQWAREHYKGMENLLIPSYSPDFKALDEEGIRNDIRNSIRHGFFSSMCIPVGVITKEHKQFLKVAAKRRRAKFLSVT